MPNHQSLLLHLDQIQLEKDLSTVQSIKYILIDEYENDSSYIFSSLESF